MIQSASISYQPVLEQTSSLDKWIRRYKYPYLGLDSLWGFWDETGACFHSGYETEELAKASLDDYVKTMLGIDEETDE